MLQVRRLPSEWLSLRLCFNICKHDTTEYMQHLPLRVSLSTQKKRHSRTVVWEGWEDKRDIWDLKSSFMFTPAKQPHCCNNWRRLPPLLGVNILEGWLLTEAKGGCTLHHEDITERRGKKKKRREPESLLRVECELRWAVPRSWDDVLVTQRTN